MTSDQVEFQYLREYFCRQCSSERTKSKSLSPCVKSSPDIKEHWKDLKGIGSVFLSPTDITMHERLFELESVLYGSSHVCPTDWMSCIGEGFRTLFLITFKCSVLWGLPLCNKSLWEDLMIGVKSRRRKWLVSAAAALLPSPLPCHFFLDSTPIKSC